MCVVQAEAELEEATDAHARQIALTARPKYDGSRTPADLEICNARLSKVEKACKLATAIQDDAQKHFVESAEAAEEASPKLMEMSKGLVSSKVRSVL